MINMQKNPTLEDMFIDKLRDIFSLKKKKINVGDYGVYQDVLSIDTINDGTHSLKYDIYTKVKAVAIYQNLVEIEIVEIFTINSCNQDVRELIEKNMPKYIHPKYIRWEIK
jgi:hypothetical protein